MAHRYLCNVVYPCLHLEKNPKRKTLDLQLNVMAATSMAAALAASLPAPSSTPAVTKPVYEAIPASMSRVIDIEAEIALTSVQLDGTASACMFAF